MSEESKLGADGLEVVATWFARGDVAIPEQEAKMADGDKLCRLTDAQRLLSQLREELAQRDAEVERLSGQRADWQRRAEELGSRLDALESQQAASVGGERDVQRDGSEFWVWLDELYGKEKVDLWMSIARSRDVLQFAWTAWQARAALSPAGGGAVQVCKLGAYGSAYDMPETCRAFTYAEQPNNPTAWKLGRALSDAHKASGGDWIDYGLGLLKALQAEGFGVFQIAKPQANSQEGK